MSLSRLRLDLLENFFINFWTKNLFIFSTSVSYFSYALFTSFLLDFITPINNLCSEHIVKFLIIHYSPVSLPICCFKYFESHFLL